MTVLALDCHPFAPHLLPGLCEVGQSGPRSLHLKSPGKDTEMWSWGLDPIKSNSMFFRNFLTD